jgi:hypothetical protein
MPIRPRLESSVDNSTVLNGSVCLLFSDVYGSDESGFLGLLFVGYLDVPFLRTQARNSGCRVAMLTVTMAVPASVKDNTANTLF